MQSASEYLEVAGCTRPVESLSDKDTLVKDIVSFHLITRMQLPVQRFVCLWVFPLEKEYLFESVSHSTFSMIAQTYFKLSLVFYCNYVWDIVSLVSVKYILFNFVFVGSVRVWKPLVCLTRSRCFQEPLLICSVPLMTSWLLTPWQLSSLFSSQTRKRPQGRRPLWSPSGDTTYWSVKVFDL